VQRAFVSQLQTLVSEAAGSAGAEVVLSFDPMHQVHNNENDYLWQIKGRAGTKEVLSNTGRRRLNILGAIDLVSHELVPLVTEVNCTSETIKVFLDEVVKMYHQSTKITIFLDNAKYQRNYAVQEYARELGITLFFMPPYSPNLCLIERLWKYFKKRVVKNVYYETYDRFYQNVCLFFKNWDVYKAELRSLFSLKFEII
jgi:transposase